MHTLINGMLSYDSIPHDHQHVIHALYLWMVTLRYPLLLHLQATTYGTRVGKLLRITLYNAKWSFQYH